MPNHKWHTITCTDCGHTLAFSHEPIYVTSRAELRCYLCTHSHAQVATWLMPIGNGMSTNSLYGVDNTGKASLLRVQFERVWKSLYARLENHRVAKAYKKSHGK